jgi:nucleoside phosphorylase
VGTGNRKAATLVERANAMFRPAAVLFVGVAGGLHADVGLGDVVVATEVYALHGGREESGGFRARPRSWAADYSLEQHAQHLARKAWWRRLLPGRTERSFEIHFKPVVSGDVVLDSRTGPVAEVIRRYYNDAVAVEMESAGAADAAHHNRCPFLAIRGISDRADGWKSAAEAKGSQPVAASNAAAFALTLAADLDAARPGTGTGRRLTQIVAVACVLLLAVVVGPEAGAIVNTCGWVLDYAASVRRRLVVRSTSLPFLKTAPARTSATRCGALTARQRA